MPSRPDPIRHTERSAAPFTAVNHKKGNTDENQASQPGTAVNSEEMRELAEQLNGEALLRSTYLKDHPPNTREQWESVRCLSDAGKNLHAAAAWWEQHELQYGKNGGKHR